MITAGGEEVARHRWWYETAAFVFSPPHDLALLWQEAGHWA